MKKPETLLETIPFMLSDDWQKRLVAEYYQISIRIDSLESALDKNRYWDDNERKFMMRQLEYMNGYKTALYERILRYGIDHTYRELFHY